MKQKTSTKNAEAAVSSPPSEQTGTQQSDLASALTLGASILIGVFIAVRPLSQFTPYAGEAAIAGLVAVMLMLCVGVMALIRPNAAGTFENTSLLPMLALWIGLFILGAIRSPNLGVGIPAATNGCLYAGMMLAAFCLARREPRMAGIVTRVLIAMIAVEAFHGIWQYKVDLPRLRQMVASGRIELPADMQSGAGIARLGGDRIFATFANPNSLAGYLLIGIFSLAGIISESRRRVTTIAGIALLLLLGSALVLTGSKGGMLACALGAWFFVAQWLAHRYPHRAGALSILTAAGIAALILLLILGCAGVLGQRPFGLSLEVRFDYWRAAYRMWREHPLTGVGLGGFSENYLYYKTALGTEVKDAHNDYAQLATELGIMGLVAYGVLWWLMLRTGRCQYDDTPPVNLPEGSSHASSFELCAMLGGVFGLLMMMFGFLAFNASDVTDLFSGKGDRATLLGACQAVALPTLLVCVVIALRPSEWRPSSPGWIHGTRAAIGAVLIHQLVDFDFRCEATMTAIFVLGGMLWAQRLRFTPGEERTALPSRAPGLVLTVVALALLPTAALIPIRSGSARANAESADSEAQELLHKMQKDKATNEERAEYAKLRNEVIAERIKARGAAPFDPETWADLAMAYESSFNANEPATRKLTLECLEHSAQLRPHSPVPQWMLGNYYMYHVFQEKFYDSDLTDISYGVFRNERTEEARSQSEVARKCYAAAAKLYPFCPGILLWEGDAALMMGDASKACDLYYRALEIDAHIDDSNVRLSAIFNDPRPGAFARHNGDGFIKSILDTAPYDGSRGRSGMLLRRMVAQAWLIRNQPRAPLGVPSDQLGPWYERMRPALLRTGQWLMEATTTPAEHAHAALLYALSFKMAAPQDSAGAAQAWDTARKLQNESIAAGHPGTPPLTFDTIDREAHVPQE
jgi:O-antigen ligase